MAHKISVTLKERVDQVLTIPDLMFTPSAGEVLIQFLVFIFHFGARWTRVGSKASAIIKIRILKRSTLDFKVGIFLVEKV